MLLELAGYCVEVAPDGLEGLQKALGWHPDAGIIDIGLPNLDGYQLAQRVREVLRDKIVLVAVSGYADRRKALESGFDVHFTKPPDPNVLFQLLASRLVPSGK
jgi:two-component system CheB/CheR fusion protein